MGLLLDFCTFNHKRWLFSGRKASLTCFDLDSFSSTIFICQLLLFTVAILTVQPEEVFAPLSQAPTALEHMLLITPKF